MLEFVVELVITLFCVLTKGLYLDVFLNKNDLRVSQVCKWIVLFVTEGCIGIYTYFFTGDTSLYKMVLSITINFVATFIATLCYQTSKNITRIITTVSYNVLAILGEISAVIIFRLLRPEVLSVGTYSAELLITFISSLVNFLFVSIVCTFYPKKSFNQSFTRTSLLVSPIITTTITLFYPISYQEETTQYSVAVTIFILSGLLFLNIINYYFMNGILEKMELKNKLDILEKQIVYQTEKYSQLSWAYKETRRVIHDVKQHNSFILNCLHKNEYERIEDTIIKNTTEMENKYVSVNTGNLVVDTFLGNLSAIAREKGYTLNQDIRIDSSSIPISEYDLSIILGNLVDNCINACEKIISQKCEIFTTLVTDQKHFIIQIKNTMPDNKENKDTSNLYHGYGTENISRIMAKYQGTYIHEVSDHYYTATLTIPIFRDTSGKIIYPSTDNPSTPPQKNSR